MISIEPSDDSDDFYFDDLPDDSQAPSNFKRLGLFAVVALMSVLGTSLASNIKINSTGSNEYGQGILQTIACSGDTAITIKPSATFHSASSTFKLTALTVSNIPDRCLDKELRISAYTDVSALELDSGVAVARVIYEGASTSRVYRGTSGADTLTATVNNASASAGFGSFTLNLTGSAPSAQAVKKIVMESSSQGCVGLYSNNPGTSAYQILNTCPTLTSGLYWIKLPGINSNNAFQIYADMVRAGGGWTLIVANGVAPWTAAEALSVNATNPPSDPTVLTSQGGKYSILSWADSIKRSSSGFDFRFDADSLGSWGGAYTANSAYSFVSSSNGNTNISQITKFGSWSYADNGVELRMPWYDSGGLGLLTTSNSSSSMWWGSLIASNPHCGTGAPGPWMENAGMSCPSKIWYWAR
ncbi:unannotated protein [freshwater metagenome]|uniref:Unannotated protein n=2 Tax=freshwater metagenome TaxID=449393 RepID=A0A6J7FMR3_9ZZZZ|nr:hypothetical protein [Actinomycetota bacterium]